MDKKKYVIIPLLYNIGPLPPPNNLRISVVDFGSLRELTFTWSPVVPGCLGLHYNILSSKACGSCPTNTTNNTVTCMDLPIATDGGTCIFAVQTTVCGDVVGNLSDPLSVITNLHFDYG